MSQPAQATGAERQPAKTADGENFPVALRLLPAGLRRDLTAIYDVARAIDEVGDAAVGDRLALLDAYAADLRRVWVSGDPQAPELRRLVPTVRSHAVGVEPFLDLVAANRLDQTQSTYPTWADLRHYCTLSADPVGRIVLAVLDAATPERVALSDDVCTALQVLEHCQDVAEDRRAGRTYLPVIDLDHFGVTAAELDAATTSPALRAVVQYEVARAERLLASGVDLVRSLRGAGRVATAGFVAGGLATADALRRADFDVLVVTPRPSKADTARHALRLVAGRR